MKYINKKNTNTPPRLDKSGHPSSHVRRGFKNEFLINYLNNHN